MSRLHKIRAGVTRFAGRAAERLAAYQAAAEEHRGREEERLLAGDDTADHPAPPSEPRPPEPAPDQKGDASPSDPERVPPPPAHPPAIAARPQPSDMVPWGVRVAAELGWRLLVLAGVIYVLMKVVSAVSLLVMSFSAGLLITALLQPTVGWLKRLGVGRGLATFLTFVGGFVAMGLIGWFVVWQVIINADVLTERVQQGIQDIRDWVVDGPFHVSEEQLNDVTENLNKWIGDNSEQLTSAGLETVSFLVEFFTGAALAAFVTLFLLYDGRRIWEWCLRFSPESARDALAGAGPRCWITLTSYVRGTVIVALIDAVGIGLGLFFLDVPLPVPLAVIVFLFAFVPIVGATVSGALAVVVAFVTNGLVTAILVLVVVLVVQQIEGNILQPFILGRMVRVHPLAVVLAVTGGGLVAGIPGAVVAVPLVAVLNTGIGYLRVYQQEAALRATPGPHGATALPLSPTPPPPSARPAAGPIVGGPAAVSPPGSADSGAPTDPGSRGGDGGAGG